MKINALSTEERIASGFDYLAVITYADFTTAGTAQNLTLAALTQGQLVKAGGYKLVTPFVSANGTGLTVSIGNGSSNTAYQAAKELQNTPVKFWHADTATPPSGAATALNGTETVFARFTTSGGTTPLLTEYTAGEVHIGLRISDVNKL